VKLNKSKKLFQEFKSGMKDFGSSIAIVINSLLLALTYLFAVGITSLIGKIFRKKFLENKRPKSQNTYWKELKLGKKDMKDYYRQF
jgi:hypothetical protein